MEKLLAEVTSWHSLLFVLLVFGFAPGFVLRIIVLAYNRDDPRRRELLGELYGVPRLIRPFWVCEQIERALFEGRRPRLLWREKYRIEVALYQGDSTTSIGIGTVEITKHFGRLKGSELIDAPDIDPSKGRLWSDAHEGTKMKPRAAWRRSPRR